VKGLDQLRCRAEPIFAGEAGQQPGYQPVDADPEEVGNLALLARASPLQCAQHLIGVGLEQRHAVMAQSCGVDGEIGQGGEDHPAQLGQGLRVADVAPDLGDVQVLGQCGFLREYVEDLLIAPAPQRVGQLEVVAVAGGIGQAVDPVP
jgi:hypothetical protein